MIPITVGARFGRLTVASPTISRRYWNCDCDCGAKRIVDAHNLRAGKTVSCGCHSRDITRQRNTRHGRAGTPLYARWHQMIRRCTDPKANDYRLYGGRGIRVCDRWHTFEGFYADMGEAPEGMSIDRIDGDGDYEPSNCRWATLSQQNRNTQQNRFITRDGRTLCATEWALEVGIPPRTVLQRLSRGWTETKALADYVPRLARRAARPVSPDV